MEHKQYMYGVGYQTENDGLYIWLGGCFVPVVGNTRMPEVYRAKNPASATINRMKKEIARDANRAWRGGPAAFKEYGNRDTVFQLDDPSRFVVVPFELTLAMLDS